MVTNQIYDVLTSSTSAVFPRRNAHYFFKGTVEIFVILITNCPGDFINMHWCCIEQRQCFLDAKFERTRMRLVDCIDHLLEIMENDDDYHSFLMDGQMTLIDDYLEIRPENELRIRGLIQNGRLEIGPWYTLADCAPVQGECVIRNIKYGMDYARSFGKVLKCGYNVFSFGQIAQLPLV